MSALIVLHFVRGVVIVGLVFVVTLVLIVRSVGDKAVMVLIRVHIAVLIGVAVSGLTVIPGDIMVLISVIGLVRRDNTNKVCLKSPQGIFVVAFIGMTLSVTWPRPWLTLWKP